MKTKRKFRIQVDFEPEAVENLDKLVDETGAKSRLEIIQRALNLYTDIVEQRRMNPRVKFEVVDETGGTIEEYDVPVVV